LTCINNANATVYYLDATAHKQVRLQLQQGYQLQVKAEIRGPREIQNAYQDATFGTM
jgi:hypothetical protein